MTMPPKTTALFMGAALITMTAGPVFGQYYPPYDGYGGNQQVNTACRSNKRTQQTAGALVGGLLGGVLGSEVAADNTKEEGAVLGGLLGAALGAGIGGMDKTCAVQDRGQIYDPYGRPLYPVYPQPYAYNPYAYQQNSGWAGQGPPPYTNTTGMQKQNFYAHRPRQRYTRRAYGQPHASDPYYSYPHASYPYYAYPNTLAGGPVQARAVMAPTMGIPPVGFSPYQSWRGRCFWQERIRRLPNGKLQKDFVDVCE